MPERWRRSAQWPGGPVAGGGRTGSPKVRGKVCSHTKGGEGPQGPPLGSAAAACSGERVWGAGFDSLSPEEMLSRGRPHGRPRQAVGTGSRRGTALHGPGQARYEQVQARAPKASGGFPEGKAAGPRGWRPGGRESSAPRAGPGLSGVGCLGLRSWAFLCTGSPRGGPLGLLETCPCGSGTAPLSTLPSKLD